MKKILLLPILLLLTAQIRSEILVDFGSSQGTSLTPRSGWNEILIHPDSSNATFAPTDGNPDHDGVSLLTANGYIGIRGTSSIAMAKGHRIVITLYNRGTAEISPHLRVSFGDDNGIAAVDAPWYTVYETADGEGLRGGMTGRYQFAVIDDSMKTSDIAVPVVGNRSLVNVALQNPSANLVVTKIELLDDADVQGPTAPGGLTASIISHTDGCQNLVRLQWAPATDSGVNAAGVEGYRIFRDGQLYSALRPKIWEDQLANGMSVTFVDMVVEPGRTYSYHVTAFDKAAFGMYPLVPEHPNSHRGNESAASATVNIQVPVDACAGQVNFYTDFVYQGAFRVPSLSGTGTTWDYAHHGLTHYPSGNSGRDPNTTLPGSLYSFNNDMRIGEISIPKPVNSKTISALPVATQIKPFTIATPSIYGGGSPWRPGNPVAGMAYHPAKNGVAEGLYHTFASSYATPEDRFTTGHVPMNLSVGQGGWHVGGVPPNNVDPALVSTLALRLPEDWAQAHTGGRTLAVGSKYLSGRSVISQGLSLYAIAPWESGALPSQNGSFSALTMVQYDSGESYFGAQRDYWWGDEANGAGWVRVGTKDAVVLGAQHGLGEKWYGRELCEDCSYDLPAPSIGQYATHSTSDRTVLMFYNAADIADVLHDRKAANDPQPYQVVDLRAYAVYPGGFTRTASLTTDLENGYLYITEQTSGQPIIHVWKVGSGVTPPADLTPPARPRRLRVRG